ncbi:MULTISPECIES: TetR/AcrR family transcriptional regulator [unclassified Saccharopolyspora]|uniref:TetR/AcrR family transcriptional regulator n=1 Tax=unclassified Saccharopolyspora TaxID=2646250 RepID=UPI001CD62959|nr:MULTISPECIES: TetR/AcrR family transcriptional regulator [unclassified Saccharopolyspora]MCA1189185.1 TetR/AcrR family transcriptional regulator [Saccharopolyspora sp. 6T]MCA1196117.1 TetR/AcrR family transcriptional regulator [Saccharopolyspora sp. 6V]MCA1226695.1 TetR/AcrR family transcriptional regulator [Saccharopolyspora sp. 6M]MCA1282925.1 TetR/AcrR family transcriptional regulator [Saccharopolyspora sp. 7B]
MLVEAAAQMFSREGTATTTNRIADRAGVSIGTLYRYFSDKEALLAAVAERHVADVARNAGAVLDRLRAEAPPFDETIRALLDAVVHEHRTHQRLHAVLHRLLPRTARDLAVVRAVEQHVVDEVAFHLERCDRGADAELTARTIVTAVDAHLHRVMAERGFSVDRLAGLVTALAPPR